MCGRYVYMDPDYIQVRFAAKNPLGKMEANYNVAPGTMNPTVSRQSPNQIVSRKWGLVPGWAKDPKIGYKMINARSETVSEKPAYRKAFYSQRCLIPANGFYEWQQMDEGKQAYFCGLEKKEMFGMAGLFETWKDVEDKQILTYTILTREAKGEMKKIHERMPVIVARGDEAEWLQKGISTERLKKIIANSVTELEIYPVSEEVNDVRNNSKELVKEI